MPSNIFQLLRSLLMRLEEDRLKALEAGADDFDTKPVDLKRLLQKIEQVGAIRLLSCTRLTLMPVVRQVICLIAIVASQAT